MLPAVPQASQSDSRAANVIRVSVGNFLEMYDFMVFGYYATAIGRAFFPNRSEYASLMLSLMTFGTGYLMRPLGAIVLGAYIDHHGRRKGLLLTLGLMAIGTLSIGCLPGYETLGLLAPLLVVAGRLVQGLSAGVEIGGVSVYLAEIAKPGRKGFYVSWQSASQQVAVMFAALLGIVLSSMLPPEKMFVWGWRIPLLIGSMLVPFLFLLRRSLVETGEFLARKRPPATREIWRMLAANWRLVLLGMMLSTTTTVTFYLITAYMPTYGSTVLRLSSLQSMIVTLCVGASNFVWLPVMGALSDRIGRRPLLTLFSLLALFTAYPVLSWLVSQPSFARLLAAAMWFSMIFGSYNGSMVVYLTEIMPPLVRASGFSLAYSLATGIFGGFTPAISTYLIHLTGNRAMPGVWLSLAGAMGLTATALLQRVPQQRERAVNAVNELPVG
ncbi:MAG: citrate-proton symporter [Terriglobia bacterium]|nr:MAG: citrate-proton symporter [Terriglobia bacterium]